MRFKGGLGLVALLALLVAAPGAAASTVSLRDSVVVYTGDPAADDVELMRYIDNRGNSNPSDDRFYYLVTDNAGITAASPCFRVGGTSNMVGCQVTSSLHRYDFSTGDGGDEVTISGDTAGGAISLGAGNDRWTGRTSGAAPVAVSGGDGADILTGGGGNDIIAGDGGDDQVAGRGGNDALDGGAGNDQLEFGGDQMAEGVGVGADDIRGGPGSDRLSYNDHASAVTVTLDGRAGDGSDGEGDNVHSDVETIVGTTLDDVLVGSDGAEDLFGHAGADRIDGLGGDDDVNGGTGDDELYGGAGDDRLEGSADEDYLEGGAGADVFEGDNVCSAAPCTGGSDFIQARDGEADVVNCGVGADTALVDFVDVVAQDTQHGCERIDRLAASAPAAAPPAGAVLGASQGAALKLRVIGVRKLRTLRRGKLRVEVTCPGSCRVRARLIFGRAVVARRSRTRLGAGVQRLALKTNKRGRRLFKRRTRVGTTLAVDVIDDQRRTTTLTRVLRFRR
jgi:Ca2+-binding RTX toxin-like protein